MISFVLHYLDHSSYVHVSRLVHLDMATRARGFPRLLLPVQYHDDPSLFTCFVGRDLLSWGHWPTLYEYTGPIVFTTVTDQARGQTRDHQRE